MIRRSPRLLIVDQSLRDAGGHHYEYDLALFRAASARGIAIVIGAHVSVPRLDLLGESLRPWFQKAWYESYGPPPPPPPPPALSRNIVARGVRFLGRIARRIIGPGKEPPAPIPGLGGEVLALLTRERFRARDHVLVHTFSIPELDTLIELARSRSGLPAIHMIFRRDADEPAVDAGEQGGIRGSLARLMTSPSAAATLRLYADTEDLACQYAGLTPGVTVGVVPIPHCLPPGEHDDDRRAEGPIRIVYLGDARDEKGFQLIPDAVQAVAERFFADGRARFVLQANIGAAGDGPLLAAARDRLVAYPQIHVQLITEQLSISAFHDLLWSADIVLLPYDRHAYRWRSSGILVQALTAGRVVVVPAGTWMAAQVDPAAAVTFEDKAGFADAVITAIDRWPALSKRAREGAARWRAEHDPSRFIARLLDAER
jgi:glycosyltransferase involved in cell wall biosynthesis